MKYGFTGTRHGMTPEQKDALRKLIVAVCKDKPEVHLGDCVGADEDAYRIFGAMHVRRIGHPPSNPKLRAFLIYDEEMDPEEYHIRNQAIVDACDRLIACPHASWESTRSGTWLTVRYARKRSRKITIIYPDGVVRLESDGVQSPGDSVAVPNR